ncbi:acyltransferase [Pseudoalteromonas sp. NZS127_1]|uniref:acyltransferase family protein n=1 Tax=Pseudoalteromonas sp. NZS127_1 TaxID=2792074 RepID=UPI0018CCF6C7|nr:acyltransferase [Pseudoalteromonas sp. NZS127_1]MBG9994555.1 acyltransferase [Pseudoalteromonas sp. NZS127_1]
MEVTFKKRIIWVDALKGITVLLVAFHHALLSFTALYGSSTHIVFTLVDKVNYILSFARIPAFFLAAGLVMASITGSKSKWFLTKRLPLMLWVIILWTVISLTFEIIGFNLYPWSNYPSFPRGYIFPVPFGNLWFVYALLALSAYAVVISRFSLPVQLVFTLLTSFAIHLFLDLYSFEFEISNMLFYNLAYQGIPFFVAGFLFKTFIVEMLDNQKVVVVVMALSLLFMLASKDNIIGAVGYLVLLVKYIPMTLFFVGFVVFVSKIGFVNHLFVNIGNNSLEFFILHQFFIALFFNYYSLESFGYVTHFLLSITIPIFVCLIFIITFKPFIRPLFILPKSVSYLGQKWL